MRLININCDDSESFKYSILLYLYYYNIRKNHGGVSQLINNLNPYIHIKLNKNNDLKQFGKDNPSIGLFVIDINSDPVFLTQNNATIKVTIVEINEHRYSLIKPSISSYSWNIAAINRINKDTCKKYEITDEIKKDLCLHL